VGLSQPCSQVPRRRTFTAIRSSTPLDGSPALNWPSAVPKTHVTVRPSCQAGVCYVGFQLHDPSLIVGLIPMLLWSTLVINLLATRQSDLPLRRSSHDRRPAAASLMAAGLLIV
jgi:hypothetical protein